MGWKPTQGHTSCDVEHPVREMPSRLFVVWYKNTRRAKKNLWKCSGQFSRNAFDLFVASTEYARASSISTKWDSTEFFPRRDKYITYCNYITSTTHKTHIKCLYYYTNDKGVSVFLYVFIYKTIVITINYLNIKKQYT